MTYVNYGSVTAVGIIFPVLILLASGLRIHLWYRHAERTEVDDILILPAVALNVAGGAAMVIGAQMHFLGSHSPPLDEYQQFRESLLNRQIELEKWEYAYWIGDVVAIGFTKLAFLFYFRRIFRGRLYRTTFDVVNWTLVFLVLGWMIAMTFANIFPCGTHFSAAWGTLAALQDFCIDTFALNMTGAIINWVIDVMMLIEPLVMISMLRMTRSRKFSISLMFLLAVFAVAAGCTRMVIAIVVSSFDFAHPNKERLLGLHYYDDWGLISVIVFWTYIEMEVGCLIATLLPTRRYFNNVYESSKGTLRSLMATLPSSGSLRRQVTLDGSGPGDKAMVGSWPCTPQSQGAASSSDLERSETIAGKRPVEMT